MRNIEYEVAAIFQEISTLPADKLDTWSKAVLEDCRDKLNEIIGGSDGKNNRN